MNLGRRCAGVIVVALALVVGVAGFDRTASAATAYRYWAYYVAAPNTATWAYSQRGPAAEHPEDGEVQGWRFAIQADRGGGLTPRVTPDFSKLCAGQAATSGKVRVGVVLDFGVADDAPAGERPPAGVVTGCVQVADGANGVDVLNAAVGAANVRIGQGLICGIDGYPRSECAASTAVTTKTAAPQPPAPTATSAGAPTAKESTAHAAAPTTSVAEQASTATPDGTTSPAASVASSSAPPSATPASSPSVSTLGALKKPSHNGFPVGAVIGGVLVIGLGVAAAVRAVVTRR